MWTPQGSSGGDGYSYIIDIPDGSPFRWVALTDAAAALVDEAENTPSTDPLGKGVAWGQSGRSDTSVIAYVGPLEGYLDNFTDAASDSGKTNVINASDYNVDHLYKITYVNAVTLPSGVRGNLVLTVKNVEIETAVTVDENHPRTLKAQDGSPYSYDKAIVAVQSSNNMLCSTDFKDSEGNYIIQEYVFAKPANEVRAQLEAAKKAGASISDANLNGSSQDKYIVGATGVRTDLIMEVTDVDGNAQSGTISYSANDLDLPSWQNLWGRSGTGDDRLKFAEGFEIVNGSQSYALTPVYNSEYENKLTMDEGWVPVGPFDEPLDSPLNIAIAGGSGNHADGTIFRSTGLSHPRDEKGTWTKSLFNMTSDANAEQIIWNFRGGAPWGSGGRLSAPYTSLTPNWGTRAQLVGRVTDPETGAVISKIDDITAEMVKNYLGDGSWGTERNDAATYDTGFAVLLDAKGSTLRWSGSSQARGLAGTRLFDSTIFTYIEQTHGTGGGIYLESYKLNDECKPVAKEGVVTMGRGAEATVTAVPEEGYRIKEFQIGGAGLKDPKTYTLESLGLVPGTPKTVDDIIFEMNADGTVDVTFKAVQDPRHIHVDFTADYYFYKIWKGGETPTKLELTAVPYAYIFTDVTLPVQTDTDAEGHAVYTDTHFSINGTNYTADDGTKYVLNANNMLETVDKDAGGNPLVTLPQVLKGNEFVGTDGAKYPVTVKFGVNFAMGDGTMDESKVKQAFTVDDTDDAKNGGYVTVLDDGGDISPGNVVWKIKYPAEGVTSLGWPALPIETKPAAHNANHVERNYWFVTEKAPAGWSKEGYDNSKAEAPGVVPTPADPNGSYYDSHVWAAASEKDYAEATKMIQQENRTKNAFMSVFSKDDGKTTKDTYGGEISNVPAVVVKGTKSWADFKNQFNTRQDIWLHIDAVVDGKVITKDILPPQKLGKGTAETQTVTWGDMEAYETDQANVKIITNLAEIPLADENGQRVTYTHAGDGSYPASNGITYWLNELVKVDKNGKTITYVIRETLDAAGAQKVVYANEAQGLVGYTAASDEVTATETTSKAKIGEGEDAVEVLTYEGKLKNELALVDYTLTKQWKVPESKDAKYVAELEDTFKKAVAITESATTITVVKGGEDVSGAADKPFAWPEAEVSDDGFTYTYTWKNVPKYFGDGENPPVLAKYSATETGLTGFLGPTYENTTDASDKEAFDKGTIVNEQTPPVGEDDETWGPQGTPQVGTPVFTPGSAEFEKVQLIDPETGKPTDETTVDALDADGNPIGTYTLDPATGKVTFTPNYDFVGTPQPAQLIATDKNGNTATAEYQPHVYGTTPLVTKDGQYSSKTGELNTQTVDARTGFKSPSPLKTIKLVDPATGKPTDAKMVKAPEGTYEIDDEGTITFTPYPEFTGKAAGIKIAAVDQAGNEMETSYTPIVVPNKKTATFERVITYKYTDANGNEVDASYTKTVTVEQIGDYDPKLDDDPTGYDEAAQDADTIDYAGKPWKPTTEDDTFEAVKSPIDEGGWVVEEGDEVLDGIDGLNPDDPEGMKALGFEQDPDTGVWKKAEEVYYHPQPPEGGIDETWGFPGETQQAPASSMFTVATPKTAADDQGNREDNAIVPDSITLVDPATGEPTDKPVAAYAMVDDELVEVGTYTYDPATDQVIFTPNDDFKAGADPLPAMLQGTDKNGMTANAFYQPHFKPKTETVTITRTIDYIYDDGTPVLDENGDPIVVTQELTFTRTATSIDPETHEPVFGDWEPSEGTMPEAVSPIGSDIDRPDYTPGVASVAETETLTVDDATYEGKKNKYPDITVVYHKPPTAGEKVTYGPKGETQKGTPPFTKGSTDLTSFTLIDPETGEPTDKITVPGEGSYTCDPKTGEVTFVPEPDFTGKATTVTVRGTDENGNTADGYYTPNVIDPTETVTKTQKITYVYEDGTPVLGEDGNPLVKERTETFTRTGTVDPETGTISWPDWESKDLPAVDSPELKGYTPDKDSVPVATAAPNAWPADEQIVYKKKIPWATWVDPATGRTIKVPTDFNADGTEPTPPAPPARNGYNFDGWDRSEDEEGNVTYTAKWVAQRYTIKYDANGGSGTMDPQNFTGADTSANSKTNEFTREGYEFVGFKAVLPDGTTLKDEAGNDLVFSSAKDFMDYFYRYGDGSEITLVAQWNPVAAPAPDTYWVTYIDPATGRVIMEKTTVAKGDPEPAPPADPARDGYVFDGWDRTVDSEGNVTYTARWKKATTSAAAPAASAPTTKTAKTGDFAPVAGVALLAMAGTAAALFAASRRRAALAAVAIPRRRAARPSAARSSAARRGKHARR